MVPVFFSPAAKAVHFQTESSRLLSFHHCGEKPKMSRPRCLSWHALKYLPATSFDSCCANSCTLCNRVAQSNCPPACRFCYVQSRWAGLFFSLGHSVLLQLSIHRPRTTKHFPRGQETFLPPSIQHGGPLLCIHTYNIHSRFWFSRFFLRADFFRQPVALTSLRRFFIFCNAAEHLRKVRRGFAYSHRGHVPAGLLAG
jgi:hypothetical protein